MAMIVGNTNPGVFIGNVVADIRNGTIPQARVDDAVRRILRTKFRMGLFSHPYSDTQARAQIFSASSQAVARQLVRESCVLLQNDTANGVKVLPLLSTDKVAVCLLYANEMGAQCGGWTISWQGSTTATGIAGQTILAGLQSTGGTANVVSDPNATNLTTEKPTKIVLYLAKSPMPRGMATASTNAPWQRSQLWRPPQDLLHQRRAGDSRHYVREAARPSTRSVRCQGARCRLAAGFRGDRRCGRSLWKQPRWRVQLYRHTDPDLAGIVCPDTDPWGRGVCR